MVIRVSFQIYRPERESVRPHGRSLDVSVRSSRRLDLFPRSPSMATEQPTKRPPFHVHGDGGTERRCDSSGWSDTFGSPAAQWELRSSQSPRLAGHSVIFPPRRVAQAPTPIGSCSCRCGCRPPTPHGFVEHLPSDEFVCPDRAGRFAGSPPSPCTFQWFRVTISR